MPLYNDDVSPYLAIPENFDGDFLSLITYLENNDIIEKGSNFGDLVKAYKATKSQIEEKLQECPYPL